MSFHKGKKTYLKGVCTTCVLCLHFKQVPLSDEEEDDDLNMDTDDIDDEVFGVCTIVNLTENKVCNIQHNTHTTTFFHKYVTYFRHI